MLRNVLLITLDQWRGDCLQHLGHPAVQTPHLSRFARQATGFSRHFAQGAPCAPSRICPLYPSGASVQKRGGRMGWFTFSKKKK